MTTSHPAGPPEAAVVIEYESEGCVIASFRNVCIAIWATQATVALVEALERQVIALEARHGPVSSIHIVVNGITMPDAATRQQLNESAKRAGRQLICTATVLQGGGFWASAMRGFLTSVQWLAGASFQKHVSGSVSEATRWLAPIHSGVSVEVSARELEEAIVALRERPSVRREALMTG